MRLLLTVVVAVTLVQSIGACDRASSSALGINADVPSRLEPLLEIGATVSLSDTGNLFVAEPAGVAVTDRFIFVSDAGSASVIQYDRTGRALRRIGRRGKGPGEFSAPGAIAPLGDTAIVVADVGTGRLSVFSVDSGAFVSFKRFPGSPFTLSVSGDTVLAGNFDAMQKNSMFLQSLHDSTGSILGPVSQDYATGRRLKFSYPFSAAAFSGSRIVVGMVGSSKVYLTDTHGIPVDSVVLQTTLRRGVPTDIEAKLAAVAKPGDEMLLVSILTAINSRGQQSTLVHVDFTPQGQSVSGKGYVSKINWSSHQQCVDAEVPLADDTRPVFSFRYDTLVVAQNIVGVPDSASSTTQVRLLSIPVCGSL